MEKYLFATLMIVAIVLVLAASQGHHIRGQHEPPLLQQSNLVYVGGFRLPTGDFGSPKHGNYSFGFSLATAKLAYNPEGNGGLGSLFVTGHTYDQNVAEISIPEPVNSAHPADLPVASVLQDFLTILPSAGGTPFPNNDSNVNRIGGIMVLDGKLMGTAYVYYPGGSTHVSHWALSSLDLARADKHGFFAVGTPPDVPNPAFVAGYMSAVPEEWQAALGAPSLTGQGELPVVSRTSFGPALFGFDPSHLSTRAPAAAIPYLYYLQSSQPPSTVANWRSTSLGGISFPPGWRTVLILGADGNFTHPHDVLCYGQPGDTVADYNFLGQLVEVTIRDSYRTPKGGHCVDPVTGQGDYILKAWAYDVNDLIAVRHGSKQPTAVQPYGLWKIAVPTRERNCLNSGTATFDPVNHRLFIGQLYADTSPSPYFYGPIIHVFDIR